jgi:hypothetical protein
MRQAQESIERLGPEDLALLEETMRAKNAKIKDVSKMIPQEKLEIMVRTRLERLRKATHLNGLISYGTCQFESANLGNITVPNLIIVAGHNGFGGNLDVNGVYKRYPDNFDGRPVYQKVLERDEWEPEEQMVETPDGQRLPATLEAAFPEIVGGRTFPTIHDSPRTRDKLRKAGRSVTVLPAKRAVGAYGDFRPVHQKESWFLFFDNLASAWCIGPKPFTRSANLDYAGYPTNTRRNDKNVCTAFARCRSVEDAVPDNLGPEMWEMYDVGRRMWIKCDRLRTRKGGEKVILPPWSS